MAGAWIVLLGTGLVVVSLSFLVFRLRNRLLLRRLRAAPRLDCGALLNGGRLTRSVLLTGATAAGPAGLLRSVAYDTPSVWFRTDVIWVSDESAPSDELRSQSKTLLKRSAGGPIGITDPTGTVLLDLKLVLSPGGNTTVVRRRSEEASLSRAHRADEAGPGMARMERAGLLPAAAYGLVFARRSDLREEVIEPGQSVSVLGRPRRDRTGAVLLGRPGALSTDGPDAWIDSIEATVASHAMMLKLLPIGLAVAAAGIALTAAGVYA